MWRQAELFAARCVASLLCLAGGLTAGAQTPAPTCQLRITTVPDGAAVTIDDKTGDVTPRVITDLAPGEHLLVLSKNGYATIRRNVTLSPDQRLALDLQMEPITGLVLIRSEPEGVDVRIGDTDRGQTPLLVTDLKLGRHNVEFKAQGFASRSVDLEIKDRKPQLLFMSLTSDSATVTLASDPQGARVMINGIDSGVTPCTVDRIPGGDVILRMELNGFSPREQAIKLRAGQRENITMVLKPLPAELECVSIPTGARIYLNNQFRGPAPVTLTGLEPGSYRVRAELEGYETSARTVKVGRAQKLTEEFRLEGNVGTLELTTEPAGVKIFIDGKEMGNTKAPPQGDASLSEALTLRTVIAGPHSVQLTKEGFAPKEFKIEIQLNQTSARHEKLVRMFIPDHEVRTSSGTERGMLLGIDTDGTIRLEIRPGVVKSYRARDVRSHQRLR